MTPLERMEVTTRRQPLLGLRLGDIPLLQCVPRGRSYAATGMRTRVREGCREHGREDAAGDARQYECRSNAAAAIKESVHVEFYPGERRPYVLLSVDESCIRKQEQVPRLQRDAPGRVTTLMTPIAGTNSMKYSRAEPAQP